MKKRQSHPIYDDLFEYHGNTEVERIRHRDGTVIDRNWIVFDTVDEAMDYFNSGCAEIRMPAIPAWMIQNAVA